MNNISLLHIALIYLAVINVVTFFVYGIDKFQIALLIFIYKNL